MWFQLPVDVRLTRCATDHCGGQPTWRLEAGGTGSNYCSACKAKIQRQAYLGSEDMGQFVSLDFSPFGPTRGPR